MGHGLVLLCLFGNQELRFWVSILCPDEEAARVALLSVLCDWERGKSEPAIWQHSKGT